MRNPALAIALAIPPVLLLALASAPAAAQPAPKGAAKVEKASAEAAPGAVKVAVVHDRRAASFANLTLTLVLPGIASSELFGQKVLVRNAVDDKGRKLDSPEGTFAVNNEARVEQKKPKPAGFKVSLASPERSAKSLKEVSGEAELYLPGRDPAAVATIPGFLSPTASGAPNEALRVAGVEIKALTKAALDQEVAAAKEKVRQKATKDGLSKEEIEEAVSGVDGRVPRFEPKVQTLLRVKDPEKRIVLYTWVDPKGKEFNVFPMEQEGYVTLTHGTDTPGPDWGLRVRLMTQKSLVKQAFTLRDVPLP